MGEYFSQSGNPARHWLQPGKNNSANVFTTETNFHTKLFMYPTTAAVKKNIHGPMTLLLFLNHKNKED
jgi:hypothetical protein